MVDAVSFPGSARWSAALTRAGRELTELAGTAAGVARVVEPAAQALAPRLTGLLSAETRALVDGTTVTLSNPLVYAARIHRRRPFMARAVDSSTDRVLDVYETTAEDILGRIEGRY